MGLRPRTGCFVNISPNNYIDISVTLCVQIHPGRSLSTRMIIIDVSINILTITEEYKFILGLHPRTYCYYEYHYQRLYRYFNNHKMQFLPGRSPSIRSVFKSMSINISTITGLRLYRSIWGLRLRTCCNCEYYSQ